MEERRLLIAVAASLVLLTVYSYLFPQKPAPKPVAAASPAPLASASPRAAASASPGVSSEVAAVAVPVADERERRVEVHTQDMEVAFSNRGARVVSWRLLAFKDSRGRAEEMVETVPGGPRPLDVETGDAALDTRLRDALFQPTAEMVTATTGPAELEFHYADATVEARKSFSFDPAGYVARVSVSVRRAGQEVAKTIVWGPGIGNPTATEREVRGYQEPEGVALAGGDVERLPASKTTTPHPLPEVRWVGVEAHYFTALMLPPGERGSAVLRSASVPGEEGRTYQTALAALDLGTSTDPATLYVGPKDHHVLAKVGHDMARVVPLGDWIGPIVLALGGLLRTVHGYVHNYGWAIIVLTVLINLAMSPLRHYSIANGVKMAKLAPEMRVIQDRYRKVPALDPKRQQMQEEIGALYARHGMSMGTQMAVGCVPLLITMPFLIAFYRVLQVSIELRGAPFLWIPDLSQKDPLFLTPILMGLSMFVMQKMTPSAMDPAQQRMMMLMPVVLVVMFFAAPSGLNLYWLASNLCSVVQQAITLRMIGAQTPTKGARK